MSFLQFGGEVLRYLTDFGLQLFVAELLFCLPLPRRRHFIWRIVPSAASLCTVPFFTDLYSVPWLSIGWFTFSFLFVYIASVFLIWLCFRVSLRTVVTLTIAAYMTQHFAHSIAMTVIGLFSVEEMMPRYLVRILLCVFAYEAFYFIFVRRLRKNGYSQVDSMYLFGIAAVTILIVYALNLWSTEENSQFNIPVRIYAAVCCVLLLMGLFGMFDRKRLQIEKGELEEIVSLQAKQQQVSKDMLDIINTYCHDAKRRLAEIHTDSCADDGAVVKLREAICAYEDNAKTGCETLDVILTERLLRCKKYGIKLSYIVDGEKLSFIGSSDIWSIFANALDNAMESCVRARDREKRVISLCVKERSGFVCIDLENYCETLPEFADGLPVTSKGDKRFHGFGVRSIRYVTEKYGGNVLMGAEDHKFYLKIIIPQPKSSAAGGLI